MSAIVPGYGPVPCPWLIIGEQPGRDEYTHGRPFVGRSGKELANYLSRGGVNLDEFRLDNVNPVYAEGNPDPTAAEIAQWTPRLEAEIQRVNPLLIVVVGRYAMRWLLGEDAELSTSHGLPHDPGCFNPAIANRANNAVVIPAYHPAAGLHDAEVRSLIAWDYERVGGAIKQLKAGDKLTPRRDEYAGREDYRDVTGVELALRLSVDKPSVVGLDTEGVPGAPWSAQITTTPGTAYVLRVSQPDFATGVHAMQQLANNGCLFVLHNASTPQGCMYDVRMCREMGLELCDASIWDTMYAAYLLRIESQSLKVLAWRWLGKRMDDYRETVSKTVGRDKQIAYLVDILSRSWPKPEPQLVRNNDGTMKMYKPQPIGKRVEKIIADWCDDDATDIEARWKAVDFRLRRPAEKVVGVMPQGTLADVPLDRAVAYAGADSDASLRLYYVLSAELERQGLTGLMSTGMRVLPVFEQIQSSGMPASRERFQQLHDDMEVELERMQAELSHKYFDGRPFNPKSSPQVATLLRRRGLQPAQRTGRGMMSTGKKSIEHLKDTDAAIKLVFDWRDRQHIRDSFCAVALEAIPEHAAVHPVKCNLKVTRVATRRLASTNPNLLAVPKRTEIGRRVRDCYVCDESEVFGSWDLGAIEMRVMAHESGDELLRRLFTEIDPETGETRDIHAETAARIFGVKVGEVDKLKHRLPAKTVGFGIIYGQQGQGLMATLRTQGQTQWDVESCDKLIKEWLRVYRGVADYINRVKAEVKRTGVVRDHWGMLRYLPGIFSDDRKLAAEAGREAVSHRIQGTAQGMIQNSMAWLHPHIRAVQRRGENVRWRLQIHDEIILSMDPRLKDEVDALVVEALTGHSGITLSVPVVSDGKYATTWGELV